MGQACEKPEIKKKKEQVGNWWYILRYRSLYEKYGNLVWPYHANIKGGEKIFSAGHYHICPLAQAEGPIKTHLSLISPLKFPFHKKNK